MPDKFNFVGCRHFRHPLNFIVMDPRFPNESDLFWAINYHDGTMCALTVYKHPNNPLNIFIQYRQIWNIYCLENQVKLMIMI